MGVYKKNFVFFSLCMCLMAISSTNAASISSTYSNISDGLEMGIRPERIRPIHQDSNKTNTAAQMCEQYTKQACRGNSSLNIVRSIVGGYETQPLEFPHMAAISNPQIHKGWHHCGASLISDNFLVTAAHCVGSSIFSTHVRLGDLNLDSSQDDGPVIVEKILEIYVHPDYNPLNYHNDIALLRIRKLSQFTEHIRPICLNVLENIPSQKLKSSGWGYTEENGEVSSNLRAVELNLLNYTDCKMDEHEDKIMICAGYLSGKKDACTKDSGGPMQILTDSSSGCSVPIYNQVGIVSRGKGCARQNSPGAYTRISHYIPWIESIVWK